MILKEVVVIGGNMKIVLDLTKLLEEGKINQAEFDKFKQFGAQATSAMAFNLLVGFGVVAVSGALLGLLPSPFTALLLGLLTGAMGIGLLKSHKWDLLAQMCILIGALMLGGGIVWLDDASMRSWLVVTILLIAGSIIARSGLLVVLAMLALSATLGSSTGYEHAAYGIVVEQPTLTIIVFSILGFVTYWIAKHVPSHYARLAIIAARTAIFLVNFGFWIGSLWGDRLAHGRIIPELVYVILWAIALIIIIVWAVRANKVWVVNISAIFLAIHFYTQWFERLGATPLTVLLAGLLALAFALGLKHFNARYKTISS